jgi:hypothetical protein
MMHVRLALALGTLTIAAATADAQPRKAPPRRPPAIKIEKKKPPAPVVGLVEQGAFAPRRGFLDDVVATDGARLGVVVTDADALLEIQLLGTADAGEIARVDVASFASRVRRFYLLGDQLFVVSGVADVSGIGTLIGLDGTVIKSARFRSASDFFLRDHDGSPAVVAYTRNPGARGGTLHQVELFDLVTARKLSKKPGQLLVGPDGKDKKLDFTPHYFLDDMTVAVGTKGGTYRKKEDQRSPDTAAARDLLVGSWIKDEAITDLIGRARQIEVMAATPKPLFARVKEDLSEVEVWRDGKPRPVTLDQPLELYVAKSLTSATRGDSLWFSLQVDPVNPPAVARKKADTEYLDLFEVKGDRAVRRARVLAPKKKLRWGWVGDVLWVMEKNVGFDRGSKQITLYRLAA